MTTSAPSQADPAAPAPVAVVPSARANVAWYALPRVLARGAVFLLLPLYTRVLTPAEFGTAMTVLAVSGLLQLIVAPGIEGVYLRWVYRPGGGAGLGTVIRIHLAGVAAVVTALTVWSGAVAELLTPGIPARPFFTLLIMAVGLSSVAAPVRARWRAHRQARPAAQMELMQGLVGIAATLIALLVFRVGAVSFLIGEVAAAILPLPLAVALAAEGWRQPWDRRAAQTIVPLTMAGFPMALSVWIVSSMDRILLHRLVGPAEAGLYSAGYQFGAAIMMVTIILNKEWQPLVLDLAARESGSAGLQGLWSRSVSLGVVLGGLIAVAAQGLAAAWLGPGFAAAASVIPIVVLGGVLRIPHLFLENLTLAAGKSGALALESLLTGGTFLAAALVLIPRWGTEGAAWAGVAAYGAGCAFLFSRAWNRYRLSWRLLALGAGSLAAMAAGALTAGTPVLWMVAAVLGLLLIHESIQYWRFLGTVSCEGPGDAGVPLGGPQLA